jgi:hypothetical protein
MIFFTIYFSFLLPRPQPMPAARRANGDLAEGTYQPEREARRQISYGWIFVPES